MFLLVPSDKSDEKFSQLPTRWATRVHIKTTRQNKTQQDNNDEVVVISRIVRSIQRLWSSKGVNQHRKKPAMVPTLTSRQHRRPPTGCTSRKRWEKKYTSKRYRHVERRNDTFHREANDSVTT